jgi:hypothetical protein
VGTPVSAAAEVLLPPPALFPPAGAVVSDTVAPLLEHAARSSDVIAVATPSMRSRDDGLILLIGVPFGVDDAAPGRWQR